MTVADRVYGGSRSLTSVHTVGIVALGFACAATLVALPPIEARTIYWPMGLGLVGAMLGLSVALRGERRLGDGQQIPGRSRRQQRHEPYRQICHESVSESDASEIAERHETDAAADATA